MHQGYELLLKIVQVSKFLEFYKSFVDFIIVKSKNTE